MVAKFCEWLQLDGVLITEEGYGNPDTDLMMNCKKVERAGTKVCLITDEFPGKTVNQHLWQIHVKRQQHLHHVDREMQH